MKLPLSLAVCLIATFVFAPAAEAHQPRLVEQTPVQIQNPKVSQAFYGELNGQPETFTLSSDAPFRLYVGILVPDLPDIGKDVSVRVEQDGNATFTRVLDGTTFEWTRFYEEFAGDWYFKGPELRDETAQTELPQGIEAGAGSYTLTVLSPDNEGKYVLVVGEKEEFPLGEAWNAVKTLPELKSSFFEKSAFSALASPFVLMFFAPVVAVLVLAAVIVYLIVRRKRNRK